MARNANAAIRSVEACACASTRAASGYAHSISTRWIVIATEGYEQFAEDLQKEIEEDTGIHFGIVEKHQFASIPITDADCQTAALGVVSSEAIWNHLKEAATSMRRASFRAPCGRPSRRERPRCMKSSRPSFRRSWKCFANSPAGWIDIKNADERRPVKTREAILHSEKLQALWNRIKHKTTYRVKFDNEKLIANCAVALCESQTVTKTCVQIRKADLAIGRGGVQSEQTTVSAPIVIDDADIQLPDVLTDLQDKTQITWRIIVRILPVAGASMTFKRNPRYFSELATEDDQPHHTPGAGEWHPLSAHR